MCVNCGFGHYYQNVTKELLNKSAHFNNFNANKCWCKLAMETP